MKSYSVAVLGRDKISLSGLFLSGHTSKANSSFSSALIAVAAGGDSALSPFTAAPHSALDEAIPTKICPALQITKLSTEHYFCS